MTGSRVDRRRARRARRAGATAAVAAVVAAAALGSVSGALTFPHPRPPRTTARISGTQPGAVGPLADGSGTPSGWAAVPYRRAQLSVPPLWLVETPPQLLCGQSRRA